MSQFHFRMFFLTWQASLSRYVPASVSISFFSWLVRPIHEIRACHTAGVKKQNPKDNCVYVRILLCEVTISRVMIQHLMSLNPLIRFKVIFLSAFINIFTFLCLVFPHIEYFDSFTPYTLFPHV